MDYKKRLLEEVIGVVEVFGEGCSFASFKGYCISERDIYDLEFHFPDQIYISQDKSIYVKPENIARQKEITYRENWEKLSAEDKICVELLRDKHGIKLG